MAKIDEIIKDRRILRRSGVAVCLIGELIGWQPDSVYQVGVGQDFTEVPVMRGYWGADLRFEGVEPHPHIYQSAVKKYPGTLHNFAISDEQGTQKLYGKLHHKDGSSLHNLESMDDLQEYVVAVTRIDDLWHKGPEGEHVLLWLDCEGCELQALQGAENFLVDVEAINVEFTGKPPAPGWCDQVEVHDLLRAYGFYRQWIHTARSVAAQYDALYLRGHVFNPTYCHCPYTIKEWRFDHDAS